MFAGGPKNYSYATAGRPYYCSRCVLLSLRLSRVYVIVVCGQRRQRECKFGADADGIKEQLQGIRKRVPFLLDDNVGAIDSVVSSCEVCAEPAEPGLNENSRENDDNCG